MDEEEKIAQASEDIQAQEAASVVFTNGAADAGSDPENEPQIDPVSLNDVASAADTGADGFNAAIDSAEADAVPTVDIPENDEADIKSAEAVSEPETELDENTKKQLEDIDYYINKAKQLENEKKNVRDTFVEESFQSDDSADSSKFTLINEEVPVDNSKSDVLVQRIKFGILSLALLLDMFCAKAFMCNVSMKASALILDALGFDEVRLTDVSFEQICMLFSYLVSFLVGGLLLYLIMSWSSVIYGKIGLISGTWRVPKIIICAFTLVFAVVFMIMHFKYNAWAVRNVFDWGAPALAFAGCCLYYGIAKLRVKVQY